MSELSLSFERSGVSAFEGFGSGVRIGIRLLRSGRRRQFLVAHRFADRDGRLGDLHFLGLNILSGRLLPGNSAMVGRPGLFGRRCFLRGLLRQFLGGRAHRFLGRYDFLGRCAFFGFRAGLGRGGRRFPLRSLVLVGMHVLGRLAVASRVLASSVSNLNGVVLSETTSFIGRAICACLRSFSGRRAT